MNAKNIAWVGSRTLHFEAMVKFLEEVMDLELIKKTTGFAEFQLNGGDKFEVFSSSSSFNTYFNTGPVAEFLVDNVAETQAAMEAKGVIFLCPAQSGGGYSWSHFRAPDGNIYGLASGNYSNPKENFYATKDNYFISTDKSRLDLNLIYEFLSTSYWAPNRSKEIIIKSVEHSMCFGVYFLKQNDPVIEQDHSNMNTSLQQAGFARVITDHATFAYLADVFVINEHRGKGLSKWLMESIMNHPSLQGLRRWTLATRDAHGLYEQFGFQPLNYPDRWMEKFDSSA